MDEHTLTMTIEEILSLEHSEEYQFYNIDELDILYPLSVLDTSDISMDIDEHITEREYVTDLCNDQRSRDLRVILYQGIPFAIYQYIGRGHITNEVIFNKEMYFKLLKEYLAEYTIKTSSESAITSGNKFLSIQDSYEIKNYNGARFNINDNSILAKRRYARSNY